MKAQSIFIFLSFFQNVVLEAAENDIHGFVTRYITGLVVNQTEDPNSTATISALIYFMGESLHALPTALNTFSNGLLRLLVSELNANKTFNPVRGSWTSFNLIKTHFLNIGIISYIG